MSKTVLESALGPDHSEPIYGPTVRWFNPLRLKVEYLPGSGWAATYRYWNGSSGVTGCSSRQEAIDSVRHSVTMRITQVNGEFVEVLDD